jgi:hypothetical protein
MVKPVTMLLAMGLLLGSLTAAHASTKLLWRSPTAGIRIVPNTQGTLISLQTVDVSAYDQFRVIAVARRPTNIPLTSGFGAPFQIELHIAEGTTDLGLLENGLFLLNPTGTDTAAPAHTERATAVFANPVITTLLLEAVGPTSGNVDTVLDLYVYGEVLSTAASP